MTYGRSKIAFVIGGSLGLHDDVMKRSDEKLSFSKMTLATSVDEVSAWWSRFIVLLELLIMHRITSKYAF